MTSNEKKLKELGAVLEKNNSLRISQAIRVLRNEPPFPGAIALLISHYDRSTSSPVRQLISEFMNDMKDQNLCGEVVAEIKRDHKKDTLQMIASSCWQSGLDYSDYCMDFADLFLTSDYMTALECFTVIESSVHELSRENKRLLIEKIKKGATAIIDEKSALSAELISVLK
jgi:predicted DNA-binding protein